MCSRNRRSADIMLSATVIPQAMVITIPSVSISEKQFIWLGKKGLKKAHTVPFQSIRQSRVTGPFQTPKSHGGHGDFGQLPKPLTKS